MDRDRANPFVNSQNRMLQYLVHQNAIAFDFACILAIYDALVWQNTKDDLLNDDLDGLVII